ISASSVRNAWKPGSSKAGGSVIATGRYGFGTESAGLATASPGAGVCADAAANITAATMLMRRGRGRRGRPNRTPGRRIGNTQRHERTPDRPARLESFFQTSRKFNVVVMFSPLPLQ